jgi:hypothetical protein
MARNRIKLGSLTHQIKSILDDKLAIGVSKYQDKKNNETQCKIYAWETYRTYMRQCNYFAKWCKDIVDSLCIHKKHLSVL